MFGTQDLVVFIVSGLLLNLASGPDSFNYDAQCGSGLACRRGLVLTNIFLAVSTAFASRRVRIKQRLTFWLNPAISALFVSFGIKLALSGRHSAKTLH